MNIFRSFEEARNIKNPVVTTGSFDGVHIGHKTILARLRMLAEKHNGESVLITFHPHPRKVLYPDTAGKDLKLINTREEKLDLLEKAGLNNVIIVEFTREFSRITSEEFVRDILCGILHAKVVVAGFNHHFGFNKEGDYRQLWAWQEKYGFEAEEIPEQEVYHETVSSTRIREAISQGYIQRANAYLDHYYIIMGNLKESGLPGTDYGRLYEIIISDESKLLPSPGIYAVSIEGDDPGSKGMVIIHRKPDEELQVLVNFFGYTGDASGEKVMLKFHKKIHGAITIADGSSFLKIRKAGEEIIELIY